MKLASILEKYETTPLDQISSDKIDETISLRLPRPVIIQEIISALSSLSYISGKITYGKPPTFAILNLILNAPQQTMDVDGFREKVMTYVQELSARTEMLKDFRADKNHQLYFKILKRAWENDGMIDSSESYILELVKFELGIWDREHFVLSHHPSILKLWDMEQEYYTVRNFLLRTGIVLTEDGKYIIADEVAVQIRRCFGMELKDEQCRRLMSGFTKEELAQVLSHYGLYVSGSKDEMIDRLIKALIPVTDFLNVFGIESLRGFCREHNLPISGVKNLVISNIIHYYEEDRDMKVESPAEPKNNFPEVPEEKETDSSVFTKVLLNLTNQQLYDCLYKCYLPTSGSKEEKVARLMESPWSERTILNHLRKEDLAPLCRKFGQQVSGSKLELIDRIIDIQIELAPIEPTPIIPVQPLPIQPQQPAAALSEPPSIMDADATPAAFEEIATQYPELDKDEQIVLSFLKEAKILNEDDLVRVALKYGLGWFLHKAHMSEMMAKLKRANKNCIKIKSLQNTNIYQWEDEIRTETVIEKKSARDIIDALRHGVVPKNNLDLLMVGQLGARNHLSEILTELSKTKSHFKFIRGQYGSGKTFLCSWLKQYALQNEYAVSFLNISHDQPLSDLPIFFSGVVNGLRTPEKTDSSALVDILESWLLNIHRRITMLEGIPFGNYDQLGKIAGIVEKTIETHLSGLNDIEPGFGQAIRSFYQAKVDGDQELASNVVAWINGSRSLSSQALREIGVKGYLESNNVFPRMRALLDLIGGARYKGLLMVVDELELVRKFPHIRQREQAFETLRLLIDEVGKNGLPGCFVIFTGTDEFFEDERYGLRSYEALADRVLSPLQHTGLGLVSMRQPIISLEALDKERLSNMIFKIRDLYAIAYSWDANQHANESSILKLIDSWTTFGDESVNRKPRPILREFIQMLDLCEENKGLGINDFLKDKGFTEIEENNFHVAN
ncbi:MAG: BREX system ATP-binding domain-containing protein [Agriterribacter sp.]